MLRTGITAAVLFVLAHFAMLIGVTTPEKFYFDEVHYVPAARQMLEPVMPQPMLNLPGDESPPTTGTPFVTLGLHGLMDTTSKRGRAADCATGCGAGALTGVCAVCACAN